MSSGPTLLPADLLRQAATSAEQLRAECADAERKYALDPNAYCAGLEAANPIGSYRNPPAQFSDALARLTADDSLKAEAFLRLVTVLEIARADTRIDLRALPPSVVVRLAETLRKILTLVKTPRPRYFRHDNEMFGKDLGIARLTLLPFGAEIVDVRAGLPRSALWTYGWSSSLQVARIFTRLRGTRPMLAGHWDRRLVAEFTVDGYRRFYRTVAEFLDLNPIYVGLVGTSWWFDPAVAQISPELAFLREEPLQGEAEFIRAPNTPEYSVVHALQGHRRAQLHREGKYQPQSYTIVWPRAALLRWAKAP